MTALSLRLLCALLLCVAPPAATTVPGAAEGACDTRQDEACFARRPRGGHEERFASLADLYVDSSGEEDDDTATSTIAITAAASASSSSSAASSSSASFSSPASATSAHRLLTAHGVAVFPRAIDVLLTRRCRAESEHRFVGLARGVQARGTNPYSPSTSTAARFCFKEICSHDPRRYNFRVAPRESPCVARAIAGRPPWRRAVAALLGEDARLLYSGYVLWRTIPTQWCVCPAAVPSLRSFQPHLYQ